MNLIRVMQVVDSLGPGGAERVAVNLANLLPRERVQTYLCTTRRDGPLSDFVAHDVMRLRLQRKWRFDGKALRRLVCFTKENKIRLLHAHGSALFIARIASLFPPYPKVIWHDHYGRYLFNERAEWIYRQAARHISAVVAVNQPLAEWSRHRLRVPSERVWYVPNFVCETSSMGKALGLPGCTGERVVCVAHFRSEKDHLNLIRAMAMVLRKRPDAHLLLVGAIHDARYFDILRREIAQQGLEGHTSILGMREDVSAILPACDIGVLSSASEGFPLALIEYGMAKLPVVATRVGQCPEILDEGRAGVLVAPRAPEQLAEALLLLLSSTERRITLGSELYLRVNQHYSASSIVQQICQIYESVLDPRNIKPLVRSALQREFSVSS